MPELVLLRHGQSRWNAENLFTGWNDVDLTEEGEAEATEAGRLLAAEQALDLQVLHTSVLTRAIRTAELTLAAAGRAWLPVRRHWRLNERHYGALQGLNKKETADRRHHQVVGEEVLSVSEQPGPEDPCGHEAGDAGGHVDHVPAGEVERALLGEVAATPEQEGCLLYTSRCV